MTIEELYQESLKQRGINEALMNPIQRQEVKRAFYSGVSMLLLHNTEVIPLMKPKEAAQQIIDFTNECAKFWINEKK